MNSELLRAVQLTQLEIMKEIHKICKENGITYYLCGGTTLGAVRHQGFIPWDDDLDIVLPRKDYEALMKKLKECLPEPYWLQDYTTDAGYWQPFAKVRKRGTVYKEAGMEAVPDSLCGIWVDIFPLDYVKRKNSLALKMRKQIVRTIGFTLRKKKFGLNVGSFSRRYVPAIVLWSVFPRAWLKKWQVMAMKGIGGCPQYPYLASISSGYDISKETYPREWFAEGVEMPFEDALFCVPKDYHRYLTQLFGEYMQLPPAQKRQGHNISNDADIIV